MAYKGDTVRFEVEFIDYSNIPLDPTDVIFSIYDQGGILLESNPVPVENRTDTGCYFYEFTIPLGTESESLVYEFKGTYKGKPVLSRDYIPVEFI